MKFISMTVAGFVTLALAAPGGRAQQSSPQPGTNGQPQGSSEQTQQGSSGQMQGSQTQGNGSMADKKFVQKAMEGSQEEIKLGQLATQKASSEQVKQFGQKMVDDHTKLSDQMKPIAEQMGVSAMSNSSSKDAQLQTKLEGLSGPAFDKAYMQAMVKDHQKDLSEFKKEAQDGKNPQVKEAAQQGSEVIQQHLQLARQVAQGVGAAGGNRTNKEGTNGTSTPAGPQ